MRVYGTIPDAQSSTLVMVIGIICQKCLSEIQGTFCYYIICSDGDFDICQNCVDSGAFCDSNDHQMSKYVFKNGKMFELVEMIASESSSTEEPVPMPVLSTELPNEESV